jgi:tRNA(adenine34) deaminase
MTPVRVIDFGGVGPIPAVPALPLGDAALEAAMDLALEEAAAALHHGDVPVGAVVLAASPGGAVLARRHNERELRGDPTAHAEVLALRDAAAALGTWRLTSAVLVVTLEPCPMCAGALVAARLGGLAFGAADPKAGACGSLYNLCADPRLNHELPVVGGVRAGACGALLTAFFTDRRGGSSTTL